MYKCLEIIEIGELQSKEYIAVSIAVYYISIQNLKYSSYFHSEYHLAHLSMCMHVFFFIFSFTIKGNKEDIYCYFSPQVSHTRIGGVEG